MKEADLFVVQVAAALEAARVWRSFRDPARTIKAHQLAVRDASKNSELLKEEWTTAGVVSNSVLRAMAARVIKLWDRYNMQLLEQAGVNLDGATDQLVAGVHREIDRIRELSGSIPTEKLNDWWRQAAHI